MCCVTGQNKHVIETHTIDFQWSNRSSRGHPHQADVPNKEALLLAEHEPVLVARHVAEQVFPCSAANNASRSFVLQEEHLLSVIVLFNPVGRRGVVCRSGMGMFRAPRVVPPAC